MPIHGGCFAGTDGVAEYIDFGNNAKYNFTSEPFTIMLDLYVYGNGGASKNEVILGRGAYGTSGWALRILTRAATEFCIQFISGNGASAVALSLTPFVSTTIANNRVVHVAVSRDGAVLSSYINGVNIALSSNLSVTPATNVQPMRAFADNAAGRIPKCFIDNIKIFNRNLSLAEILNEMVSPTVVYPDNCIGAWNCDDAKVNNDPTTTTVTAQYGGQNGTYTATASNKNPTWCRVVRPGLRYVVQCGTSETTVNSDVAAEMNHSNTYYYQPEEHTSGATAVYNENCFKVELSTDARCTTTGAGTLKTELYFNALPAAPAYSYPTVNQRIGTANDRNSGCALFDTILARNQINRIAAYASITGRTTDVYVLNNSGTRYMLHW